ncbi:Silent information regulator protein Sir2 [Pyrobaculum neutrophilum V24Sta]|uniref:NAD-dependent protein deacetylase n=1 Tax=Pyrobaculum neutrophilum (strain DSM 2338 / JCM 9278 / NBRC 100436 / V24Sta) TaxID=444157 RepID=B1YAY2_PYRNV|nr:Silent information regulator protein Sir2 [Pyrobaculum neutrophilum V24Sta]
MDIPDEVLDGVADLVARSRCTVALTGAGISTASGIPDFRGPQGLWRTVDSDKFDIAYFRRSPDEVWDLFRLLFTPLLAAVPNPAHYALARLEEAGKLCAVVTQNVDGLHQRAGSRRVVELHGSLKDAVCTKCGARLPLADVVKGRGAPRCPLCGGVLKPDVVFFGEPLPRGALEEALELAETSDVFLAVGTSLTVYPANTLPLRAKRQGAKLVIINAEETALDHLADYVVRGRAEVVLPKLAERVLNTLS